MKKAERSLIKDTAFHIGNCGGFPFGGKQPQGIEKITILSPGTTFPNGAECAILLTFDVEGNYGNGTGDTELEISNYRRICQKLSERNIPATFNVIGKMVEDYGGTFLEWMLECGSEIASHGYIHDMNKRYGGNNIYAGQYGLKENMEQVRDGVNAIEKQFPGTVNGIRMPYAHFNEYTYDAIEKMELKWASNTGIDDFINQNNGFGNGPFKIKMGNKTYSTLEIPFDTQTFDWAIWLADKTANHTFVEAVEIFCNKHYINLKRTPANAVKIWEQRILDSIENKTIFTLLCHPINLTVKSALWEDPVSEFLLPVIDLLGLLAAEKKIWVCTCMEMAEFYKS